MSKNWIDQLLSYLVVAVACVNAYAFGTGDARASCSVARCVEVSAYANVNTPQSAQPTVSFDIFFTSGGTSGEVVLDPAAGGGTRTQHATAMIGHRHHCRPFGVNCAAGTTAADYSVALSTSTTGCNSIVDIPDYFCQPSE